MLSDAPKDIPNYVFQIKPPENLSTEDADYFYFGINNLNEYATSYATNYYLQKQRGKARRFVMGKTDELIDASVSGANYGRTYKFMNAIKNSVPELEFQNAIFSVLFAHDPTNLNRLIDQAQIQDVHNLQDLAIFLGKKTFIGKHRNFFSQGKGEQQTSDVDAQNKMYRETEGIFGRLINTYLSAGNARTLGIAQITVGSLGFFEGVVLWALPHFISLPVIALSAELIHKTIIHESIHAFSFSPEFFGLIPGEWKKKENLPHEQS